jgi:hypothetical protein
MNHADFGVRVSSQKPEKLILAFDGLRLGAAPSRPDPGVHR